MNNHITPNSRPTDKYLFSLIIRWISFIPIGFILTMLLYFIVLVAYTLVSKNDDIRMMEVLSSGGPAIMGMIITGYAAFLITDFAINIAPKPKIAAIIYGLLYIIYAVTILKRFSQLNYFSIVVAMIVVFSVSLGSVIGVIKSFLGSSK